MRKSTVALSLSLLLLALCWVVTMLTRPSTPPSLSRGTPKGVPPSQRKNVKAPSFRQPALAKKEQAAPTRESEGGRAASAIIPTRIVNADGLPVVGARVLARLVRFTGEGLRAAICPFRVT